jgi:hypothetical protein
VSSEKGKALEWHTTIIRERTTVYPPVSISSLNAISNFLTTILLMAVLYTEGEPNYRLNGKRLFNVARLGTSWRRRM